MDILFTSTKMLKICSDSRLRARRWGPRRAKIVGRRLDDLRAARCLEDIRYLPGRCHELKGDRRGKLALDLDGPYRLIFEVADEPIPCRTDGGLAWDQVTAVRILGVEDYPG